MALKDFQGRGEDIFDDISYSFDKMANEFLRLRNNTRPIVPKYNFATDDVGDQPLNPSEGQIALGVDDNTLRYYVNGEWRTSGGLSFDTYPQTGDWLEVKTTGSNPSTDYNTNYGIRLRAEGDDPDGTIELWTQGVDNPDLYNEITMGSYEGYSVGIGIFSRGGFEAINYDSGRFVLRQDSNDDDLTIKTLGEFSAITLESLHSYVSIDSNQGIFINDHSTDDGILISSNCEMILDTVNTVLDFRSTLRLDNFTEFTNWGTGSVGLRMATEGTPIQILLNHEYDRGTGTFTIYAGRDSALPHNAADAVEPLLRVTDDGTYHIKSGASWVADL